MNRRQAKKKFNKWYNTWMLLHYDGRPINFGDVDYPDYRVELLAANATVKGCIYLPDYIYLMERMKKLYRGKRILDKLNKKLDFVMDQI